MKILEPDSAKVRTWTDRSRSFSVDAQFLGLKDGKLHLHKMNGVKIAVPISKMSREDLEYVENLTGISLDDDKPLADVKRARSAERKKAPEASAGASIEKKPDYDWFQFFLSCEVAVGLCERYAQAFIKDSMDESVLSDVDANTLRALGLREGDIIKVMRALDAKYGRNRGGKQNASSSGDGEGSSGGLFSGPGGTLRNNTRKGRPAPAVQTSDVVDAKAFSKSDSSEANQDTTKSPPASSPTRATPETSQKVRAGFDDDAWDVKPTKQQPPPESKPKSPEPQVTAPPPTTKPLTGSMQELSLLTEPLQPTKVEAPPPIKVEPIREPPAPAQSLPGASPAFFTGVAQSQPSPQALLRQRPTPPQTIQNQGPLVPPPPQRPLSAPQSAQPSAFSPPPLVPQMTGAVQGQVAPLGQSLSEITQARLQQQYTAQVQQQQQPLQPTMTGYPGPQGPGMVPFQTGAPASFMSSMMTGVSGPSPYAPIQTQPTGFQPSFSTGQPMYGQQHTPGNINSYLPPPLEPQRTGLPAIQPQATGFGGINGPMAPMPLQPQQTGPAPAIRFGMSADAKKLAPQATGRRANLAHASTLTRHRTYVPC